MVKQEPLHLYQTLNHSEALEPFRQVPWLPNSFFRVQLPTMLVVILPLLGLIAFVDRLVAVWAAIVGFSTLAASIYASIRVLGRLSLLEMKRQGKEDERNLGLNGKMDQYVGISYINGVVGYRKDTSWDRGILEWRNGYLSFDGYGPSFSLPASMIQSIRVMSGDSPFHKHYRIIIQWQEPDGPEEYICAEWRLGESYEDIKQKSFEFSDRLNRLWPSDNVSMSSTFELPFRSSAIHISQPTNVVLSFKDEFRAFAVFALLLAIVTIPARLLFVHYHIQPPQLLVWLLLVPAFVAHAFTRSRILSARSNKSESLQTKKETAEQRPL